MFLKVNCSGYDWAISTHTWNYSSVFPYATTWPRERACADHCWMPRSSHIRSTSNAFESLCPKKGRSPYQWRVSSNFSTEKRQLRLDRDVKIINTCHWGDLSAIGTNLLLLAVSLLLLNTSLATAVIAVRLIQASGTRNNSSPSLTL